MGPRDGDSRGRGSSGTVRVGKAKQRCQSRGAVSMKAQSIRGGFGCLGGKKGVEQMSLQGPAGERLCVLCVTL